MPAYSKHQHRVTLVSRVSYGGALQIARQDSAFVNKCAGKKLAQAVKNDRALFLPMCTLGNIAVTQQLWMTNWIRLRSICETISKSLTRTNGQSLLV